MMLNILSTLFLFSPPQAGGEAPNPWIQILPMAAIFGVFYFFMIRPQQKKQKDREKALDTLKKGDKVVTIGGVHGKVISLDTEKKTVLVEVADNVKLKYDRSAIATIEKTETAEKLEAAQ